MRLPLEESRYSKKATWKVPAEKLFFEKPFNINRLQTDIALDIRVLIKCIKRLSYKKDFYLTYYQENFYLKTVLCANVRSENVHISCCVADSGNKFHSWHQGVADAEATNEVFSPEIIDCTVQEMKAPVKELELRPKVQYAVLHRDWTTRDDVPAVFEGGLSDT